MAFDQQLKEKILEATEQGLQIICDIVGLSPNDVRITGSKGVSRKAFRSPLRSDDDKPSAWLFKGDRGNWGIKDFAGQWMDCFEFYMREEHHDNFYIALLELARKYGVEVAGKTTTRKAKDEALTKDRIAEIVLQEKYFTKDEKTGDETHFNIVFKEEFSDADLAVFNPKVTGKTDAAKDFYNEILTACKFYGLKPVEYYETVKIKGGQATGKKKFSSEGYPIFAFDFDTWGKVYEPYASEWKTMDNQIVPPLRFRHYGVKPNRFLYGLDQLKGEIKTFRDNEFKKAKDADITPIYDEDGPEYAVEVKKLWKRISKKRLPAIILCTGGSDGINIKALGYHAVWSNSETEFIQPHEMRELQSYAEEIYYVGDLDKTGIESTHKIGLMYQDQGLKLIRLPQELAQRSSWSKKPCKDVKDFARYYSRNDFAGLMRVACSYRFWQVKEDMKGQNRGYNIDIINTQHFLEHQGFYRYPNQTNKLQYEMVKLEEHVMTVQDGVSIKNFLQDYVYKTRQEKPIREAIMKAKIIGEQIIHSLPELAIQTSKGTYKNEYFFFRNKVWNITPEGVEVLKTNTGLVVWENELFFSKRDAPEVQEPFFTVDRVEGKLELKIHRQDHPFMQYLINASRKYWRKEFEAAGVGYYENNAFYNERKLNTLTGEYLDTIYHEEQIIHFISKVCALGYLYHSAKQDSKAYLVWCTENAERDLGDSQGGTGKSIFGRAVKEMLPTDPFNAKMIDFKRSFVFQNVTEKVRMIWFDETPEWFSISPIFSFITGPMKVEGKHQSSIEIPFQRSPKFLVTSNFNPRETDSSTMRRLWLLAWSDFYHGAPAGYGSEKTAATDLGHQLFSDWDNKQWDGFLNIIKDCMVAWLKLGKVDPPMTDIKNQTLRAIMGTSFLEWGEQYLLPFVNKREAGSAEPKDIKKEDGDTFIPKEIAKAKYAEYLKLTGNKEKVSPDMFKKKLEKFCEYHGIILNPGKFKEKRGSEVRMDKRHIDLFGLSEDTSSRACYFLLQYVSAEEMANTPPPTPQEDEIPF